MLFFIFGLFLGSLLNNIAYRLVRGENFVIGSSKCDYCQKKLNWYELIPILSYIIQKGQCRNCKTKISFRYPLTELISGLFAYKIAEKTLLLNAFNLTNFIYFLYFLFIVSLLLILALYDLETFYIEERIIYFAIIFWLIFIISFDYVNFPHVNFADSFNYLIYLPQTNIKEYAFNRLYFGYLLALGIVIIFLLTLGKGIGLGDAKILFILGLYFNFGDIILTLVFSIIIGGIFSLFILFKKRKTKQSIPFVPFIFISLFLTIIAGELVSNILFENLINLDLK